MTPRWPSLLWVVRHGQSAGNVARDEAHAAGARRTSRLACQIVLGEELDGLTVAIPAEAHDMRRG